MVSISNKSIVFCAEANTKTGAGHVVRSMALANVLTEQGNKCSLITREETLFTFPNLSNIANEVDIITIPDNEVWSGCDTGKYFDKNTDWLVVDNYQLDREFELQCRDWARQIMVIDDLANRHHDCDILLDQSPLRKEIDYIGLVPSHCKLLTGSQYALLRSTFYKNREKVLKRRRKLKNTNNILVNFGGTDPNGNSLIAIEGLEKTKIKFNIDVVIGKTAPCKSHIYKKAENSKLNITVYEQIEHIHELIGKADFAIGASGISALERCCFGLPSIIYPIADNQIDLSDSIASLGAAVNLAHDDAFTAETLSAALMNIYESPLTIEEMSSKAILICDGRGALRCSWFINNLDNDSAGGVYIRTANFSDRDKILEWQSEPETRRYARNTNVPSKEEHCEWFSAKLSDHQSMINMICCGSKAIGVLRLDKILDDNPHQPVYELSILVSPDYYRQGIAKTAIMNALILLPDAKIRAEVHPENIASNALFQSLDFVINSKLSSDDSLIYDYS